MEKKVIPISQGTVGQFYVSKTSGTRLKLIAAPEGGKGQFTVENDAGRAVQVPPSFPVIQEEEVQAAEEVKLPEDPLARFDTLPAKEAIPALRNLTGGELTRLEARTTKTWLKRGIEQELIAREEADRAEEQARETRKPEPAAPPTLAARITTSVALFLGLPAGRGEGRDEEGAVDCVIHVDGTLLDVRLPRTIKPAAAAAVADGARESARSALTAEKTDEARKVTRLSVAHAGKRIGEEINPWTVPASPPPAADDPWEGATTIAKREARLHRVESLAELEQLLRTPGLQGDVQIEADVVRRLIGEVETAAGTGDAARLRGLAEQKRTARRTGVLARIRRELAKLETAAGLSPQDAPEQIRPAETKADRATRRAAIAAWFLRSFDENDPEVTPEWREAATEAVTDATGPVRLARAAIPTIDSPNTIQLALDYAREPGSEVSETVRGLLRDRLRALDPRIPRTAADEVAAGLAAEDAGAAAVAARPDAQEQEDEVQDEPAPAFEDLSDFGLLALLRHPTAADVARARWRELLDTADIGDLPAALEAARAITNPAAEQLILERLRAHGLFPHLLRTPEPEPALRPDGTVEGFGPPVQTVSPAAQEHLEQVAAGLEAERNRRAPPDVPKVKDLRRVKLPDGTEDLWAHPPGGKPYRVGSSSDPKLARAVEALTRYEARQAAEAAPAATVEEIVAADGPAPPPPTPRRGIPAPNFKALDSLGALGVVLADLKAAGIRFTITISSEDLNDGTP